MAAMTSLVFKFATAYSATSNTKGGTNQPTMQSKKLCPSRIMPSDKLVLTNPEAHLGDTACYSSSMTTPSVLRYA